LKRRHWAPGRFLPNRQTEVPRACSDCESLSPSAAGRSGPLQATVDDVDLPDGSLLLIKRAPKNHVSSNAAVRMRTSSASETPAWAYIGGALPPTRAFRLGWSAHF
jgi:hypothetical protein